MLGGYIKAYDGSKARAYCLAPTRDDAVVMARGRVLSKGKLEKAEQVTAKSLGHNHEMITEVCLYGGIQVEVIG